MTSKVAELKPGHGYNAVTGTYGDLYADGVIDPVKVTRSALANAASIASLLLTTETLVVEKPEERRRSRPATGTLTDHIQQFRHNGPPCYTGGPLLLGQRFQAPAEGCPGRCLPKVEELDTGW